MILRGGFKALAVGALVAIGSCGTANAARGSHHATGHSSVTRSSGVTLSSHSRGTRSSRSYESGTFLAFSGRQGGFRHGHTRFTSFAAQEFRGHSGGSIQCVTFARADSGIELSGNANTWWNHAEGVYERGSRPEPGSVLNFRATGSMHMGHVAVVNQVVDSRTVAIDHANWGGPGAVPGGISRDITVVDVSSGNDWSAVRVGLGHSGEFGSIYPTFGFIYNRPDHGVMIASNEHRAAMPALNPAPRDLRGDLTSFEEVAEAPDLIDAAPRFSYHGRHAGRMLSFRTVAFRSARGSAGRGYGSRGFTNHSVASHIESHRRAGRHSRA